MLFPEATSFSSGWVLQEFNNELGNLEAELPLGPLSNVQCTPGGPDETARIIYWLTWKDSQSPQDSREVDLQPKTAGSCRMVARGWRCEGCSNDK